MKYQTRKKAILLLADGTIFHGKAVGDKEGTAFGEACFGAAGLTENQATKEGFDIVTGTFEGIDKHPGTLPGTHKQIAKLIVSRESGMLIGGEVIGGPSTGEMVNIIGLAIQNRMALNAILTAQIGTHPLLTGPPTAYTLIKAAEAVSKKIRFKS